MRAEHVNVLSLMIIFRSYAAMSIHGQVKKIGKGPVAVMPPGQHFQHRVAEMSLSGGESHGEKSYGGLWAFHQRVYFFADIGPARMGSDIVEVFFDLLVDLLQRALKQWLFEVAIAHFPGKVTDSRKHIAGHEDHPVEKRAERFLRVRRQGLGTPQPPFKDSQHRGDLLLYTLV